MYNDYYNRYGYKHAYLGRNRNSNEVVDEELISLKVAVDSIKEALKSEKKDELFYDNLISIAPDDNAKEIISSMRDDEKRHNEILRFIYNNITGEIIELPEEEITIEEMTYENSIEKALFEEVEAIKKYRKILGAMTNPKIYTLILAILTDEIRHIALYNYLMNKNMINNK